MISGLLELEIIDLVTSTKSTHLVDIQRVRLTKSGNCLRVYIDAELIGEVSETTYNNLREYCVLRIS